MIKVLIVAGGLPREQSILIEAFERFHALGAKVALACYFDVNDLSVAGGLAEVTGFGGKADDGDERFRMALKRAAPNRRIWLHAQRSPWVRQRARQADLLVAADPSAVHTVWELAQRNAHADAVYGLAASLRAAEARMRGSSVSVTTIIRRWLSAKVSTVMRGGRRFGVRAARGTLRRVTSPSVMRVGAAARLWGSVVSAPGIPDRVRVRLTIPVHRSMVTAGRPALAERSSAAALKRLRDPQARANLLTREAAAILRLGQVPLKLDAALSAQLALADAHLTKRDTHKAARALSEALVLASNRVLHFDRLSSPLAENPALFRAPFHRSVAAQRLSAPRGRAAPHVAAPPGRPLRLLLATLINDNFLREIREHYEAMPGVEVRFLDLQEDESRRWLTRDALAMMEYVLAGHSPYGANVDEWLRPHLDWADTVFVDWCVSTAAMFTLNDPGTTRVIVRLHSFEAFGLWPHLVDFSRVDDVVFVSDHLRDLSMAVIPRLAGEHAPRLSVISNAMDLRRYPRDKPAAARFNLALVGIGAVAKDPRWAIEVLRLLREHDSRYRLLLIGSDLNPKTSAAAKHYAALLQQDLAELEPSGAVRRIGQTDDVPGALADIGVIMSSSVRESFHCALVEGVASGAVPVVRDWPFFAGKPHGARTLFPADWVVDTPEEAAKRILAIAPSERDWREAGRAASSHAISSWDWSVTKRQFDQLLLGSTTAADRRSDQAGG